MSSVGSRPVLLSSQIGSDTTGILRTHRSEHVSNTPRSTVLLQEPSSASSTVMVVMTAFDGIGSWKLTDSP